MEMIHKLAGSFETAAISPGYQHVLYGIYNEVSLYSQKLLNKRFWNFHWTFIIFNQLWVLHVHPLWTTLHGIETNNSIRSTIKEYSGIDKNTSTYFTSVLLNCEIKQLSLSVWKAEGKVKLSKLNFSNFIFF